jgi:hypothetical protein
MRHVVLATLSMIDLEPPLEELLQAVPALHEQRLGGRLEPLSHGLAGAKRNGFGNGRYDQYLEKWLHRLSSGEILEIDSCRTTGSIPQCAEGSRSWSAGMIVSIRPASSMSGLPLTLMATPGLASSMSRDTTS